MDTTDLTPLFTVAQNTLTTALFIMDYSDKEILDIVGYAVVFGAIWIIYRSPLLLWICKVIGLFLACFGVIIGVLFVVFSVYIPRGEYITAIITILLFIGFLKSTLLSYFTTPNRKYMHTFIPA